MNTKSNEAFGPDEVNPAAEDASQDQSDGAAPELASQSATTEKSTEGAEILESPPAHAAAAEQSEDDALQELESIDARERESGSFELVQELEYITPSKSKKEKKSDEPPAVQIDSVAQAREVLDALLFATNEPLSVARLSKLLNNLHPRTVRGLLLEMQLDYDNRGSGIQITEVAGGFQMSTRPHLADWVFKLHRHRRRNPLSPATLETLAIIAYKQPVTKAEVETIRGVESSATIRTLLELGLVDIGGRREVIGRPQLYVTTNQFLKAFGLRTLADMPSIQELKQLFAEDQKLKVKPAAPAPEQQASEDLQAEARDEAGFESDCPQHESDDKSTAEIEGDDGVVDLRRPDGATDHE